ncbi:MAG: radical SAM protein [Candidatus Woesearchaeota archaeon]|nr:radical SAM protein [Candidatus Woesearchaeota archaeon]
MPKEIVIMANSECNIGNKCKHCHISYKGHRKPKETVKLVEELTMQGFQVIIAGSEPLLNLSYLAAYEKAGQKYILTNGILLHKNPQIFDELHEHGIEEVKMSLHFGIQENLKSVPEEIVAKAVHEAKRRGFKVQISTTISQKNYRCVPDACKRSHELGADSIKFIRYIKSGKAIEDFSSSAISENERRTFFGLIDSAREMYDKDAIEIRLHGNFGPKKGTNGEELAKANSYCPAGNSFFVVSPDNAVYGCPFLMQQPIGKLTKYRVHIDRELCSGKRDKCLTDYLCEPQEKV